MQRDQCAMFICIKGLHICAQKPGVDLYIPQGTWRKKGIYMQRDLYIQSEMMEQIFIYHCSQFLRTVHCSMPVTNDIQGNNEYILIWVAKCTLFICIVCDIYGRVHFYMQVTNDVFKIHNGMTTNIHDHLLLSLFSTNRTHYCASQERYSSSNMNSWCSGASGIEDNEYVYSHMSQNVHICIWHRQCILYTQMAGVLSCIQKGGQRMYTHVNRKMQTFVYVTLNMHIVYAYGGCSVVHVEKGQRMYTHVSRKMYTFVYVTPNMHSQMAGVLLCIRKRGQRLYTHVSRKMYTFVYVTHSMHIVYTNGGCSVVYVEKRTTNVYSCEPENVHICVCHTQYAFCIRKWWVFYCTCGKEDNEHIRMWVEKCTHFYMSHPICILKWRVFCRAYGQKDNS